MSRYSMRFPQAVRGSVESCRPSRRAFLQGATGLMAISSFDLRMPSMTKSDSRILAYVGTYTPNGEGIHLFQMDPSTGSLTPIKVFPGISNPTWLAFAPDKKFLYALSEVSEGTVSAFQVDRENGNLTLLNTVSSAGDGPAHLSVHPSGRHVFVANYGSGSVAVLPVTASGALAGARDIQQDEAACTPVPCPVGPGRAQNAPAGNFAISGHDAPHAHMVQSDPGGKHILVNDLGLDRTIVWKFDMETGKLSEPTTVAASPGAGPRHFAFHPNGRWLYSVNEQASTLAFMTYDALTGTLTPMKEVSALPSDFAGTSFASAVLVSVDGKFVYASNRLHDSVAVFSVGASGEPTLVWDEWTRADYPRGIAIDPAGKFLYSCNHRGDSITVFRIEDAGGKLQFTGQYVAVGSPSCLVFL